MTTEHYDPPIADEYEAESSWPPPIGHDKAMEMACSLERAVKVIRDDLDSQFHRKCVLLRIEKKRIKEAQRAVAWLERDIGLNFQSRQIIDGFVSPDSWEEEEE
jgi:hypothetical protein